MDLVLRTIYTKKINFYVDHWNFDYLIRRPLEDLIVISATGQTLLGLVCSQILDPIENLESYLQHFILERDSGN